LFARWRIIDHDHFIGTDGLALDRVEAVAKIIGTVARADRHRDTKARARLAGGRLGQEAVE
jgi:hypothetical protein